MRRHKQATYPKYGPVELRKAWVSLNLNHVQVYWTFQICC